jgi:T5SS/PEP-CTERM-associated repeat protein
MALPSAEAADLVVDSGTTTISDTQSYGTTIVATSASDTATLAVTTSGTLTNSGDLNVGLSGNGKLTVSGGSVTNGEGWVGRDVGSVGSATVSSGTWANSGLLAVAAPARSM